MVIRGVLSAFLLSSTAVLVATNVWGTQAAVPFTVGELTGALVTLVTLGSSLSFLFWPSRIRPVSLAHACEPRADSRPVPILERFLSRAPHCPATASARARQEGQISPYFPGIRAWSYLSCPPSRRRPRPYALNVTAATSDVMILDYKDCAVVSERFGLLPEHLSVHPRSVS